MLGLMDLHSHTVRCRHATGSMEAYVERAIALGLRDFGFSDHSHWMLCANNEYYAMQAGELDDYVADVRSGSFTSEAESFASDPVDPAGAAPVVLYAAGAQRR